MAGKVNRRRLPFRIKRGTPGLPARDVKAKLPGELVRAMEIAAEANGVEVTEILREGMSRVLRVELKMAKQEAVATAEKEG